MLTGTEKWPAHNKEKPPKTGTQASTPIDHTRKWKVAPIMRKNINPSKPTQQGISLKDAKIFSN